MYAMNGPSSHSLRMPSDGVCYDAEDIPYLFRYKKGFSPFQNNIKDLDVSYKKVCFYQFTFIYIIALSNNKNGNVYFIYRDEWQIAVDPPPPVVRLRLKD